MLETNSVAIEARREVKTIMAKGGNAARDDSERLLPIEWVNPDVWEISATAQPAPKRRRTVHGNFRWTYGQSIKVEIDEVSAYILTTFTYLAILIERDQYILSPSQKRG